MGSGCEPYMSMTDRIPAQARTATGLLPETPRYVGMVDLETVMTEAAPFLEGAPGMPERLSAGAERLQRFLRATGMDPQADLTAVYGAAGSETAENETAMSAVLFADLAPAQLDRYLARAPASAGRAATYRGVPVYHLALGALFGATDTLSVGVVRDGLLAVAPEAAHVRAMIDRSVDDGGRLQDNDAYMALVERVAHESTAWGVGRGGLQAALRDSGRAAAKAASREAGVQQLLGAWADRMLGLPEDGAAEQVVGAAEGKMDRLVGAVQEQALAVTLTDAAVEGRVYLTMRDEASAAGVTDLAKGALAAVRLSGDASGQSAVLRDVTVEREGPVVQARGTVTRARLREWIRGDEDARAARGTNASTRRADVTIRRSGGTTHGLGALRAVGRRPLARALRAGAGDVAPGRAEDGRRGR